MSLINEALKKAQRSRTAGGDGSLPPMPGGGHIAKRGQARSANTMVLISCGAVVLVVLSVVATIYLINRPQPAPAASPLPPKATTIANSAPATVKPLIPPAPPTTPPAATPPAEEPVATAAATPPAEKPVQAAAVATTVSPVQTPAVNQPPPQVAPATAPSPTTTAPIVTTAAPPVVTPAPRPPTPAVVEAPTPVTRPVAIPSVTPPQPRPDERIAAIVEAMRIAGVRSSGADARVLIGERVYKVNDIVDRALGLRLIKVAPGVLTFADANGVTYAKNL